MRIFVEHSTTYRYQTPVSLEPHTFRLRPRMTSTQRLLAFEIRILPEPAGTTEILDQDGNLVLHVWFHEQAPELKVLTRFTVEVLRENPFDWFLGGEGLQVPMWYSEPLSTALTSYRREGQVAESVKQFAKSLANGARWNTLSFLSSLNYQLFQNFRHVVRPEGPPWASDLTLSAMEGSCRDLTILFCDACRVMGIAARFVSGYESAAAGRSDSYMHAWAEVYLPNAGWRGYDPSRGLLVTNSHVAVAAGFDHNLAAPISGVFFGGASKMTASINMQVTD